MTLSLASLEIEPSNAETALRGKFEHWLAGIVKQPEAHTKYANTLSLLEHIGSVKIARTQSGQDITEEELQHFAEEARHAQYMKRMARRIGAFADFDYSDRYLLAGPSARVYFAKLDVIVRRFVRRYCPEEIQRKAAYNLVTWLVERRAMWLYPAYQQLLGHVQKPKLSVQAIIGEETRHLEEICEGLQRLGLDEHPAIPDLVREEEELFRRLAEGMMRQA